MADVIKQTTGPLVLGAGGRLGRAWQTLWAGGHWPDSAQPLWHGRKDGALVWDMLSGPAPVDPPIADVSGVIVLAGVTGGDEAALSRNTDLALAAIRMAADRGIGPVLLCSSGAVYGRAPGVRAECDGIAPVTPYGAAKAAMEVAVVDIPGVTSLRIANVAGCDMLLGAAALGRVRLDQFADGTAPRRAYIGPVTLAATALRLIALAHAGTVLPTVLNIASPGTLGMDEVLSAAGVGWDWQPAPDTALRTVAMDTRLLRTLAPIAPTHGTAAVLVAEARAAGWIPAP